jgi:hypothetical protein
LQTHNGGYGGPPAFGEARNRAAQGKVVQLVPAMGFHLREVSLPGEGFRPLHFPTHEAGDFEGGRHFFILLPLVCGGKCGQLHQMHGKWRVEYAFQVLDAMLRLIVYIIKYHGDASGIDNDQAKIQYLTNILLIFVLALAGHARRTSHSLPTEVILKIIFQSHQ